MKLEDDDDRLVLIAAFRYALGRMTYMPGVIAGKIIEQWPNISDSDRRLIHREIGEHIDSGTAGMACDIDTWSRVLDLTVEGEDAKG